MGRAAYLTASKGKITGCLFAFHRYQQVDLKQHIVKIAMFNNCKHPVKGVFVIFRQNHCINDADFEELMNRNRAVTSTAITKAVSSATAGVCNRFLSSCKKVRLKMEFCHVTDSC